MKTAICIRDLNFAYDKNTSPVISKMTVSLSEGSVTAILGANGVGKTTLLYLLLGFYTPDQGEILFFDRPVSSYKPGEIKRMIGMVSQQSNIPFDLTVEDYVLLGRAPHLHMLAVPGASDRAAVKTALFFVGMTHMAKQIITRLSSGEKQLVHMARALAQVPGILLLDEPCSHLDLINTRQVLSLIRTIAGQGRTVVFTTHDPNAAAITSDHIMLMKKGQLVAFGRKEDILTSDLLTRTYGGPVEVVQTSCGPFIRTM